ncbi:MAG: glycoside hydrolase family 43 protein [Sphingobacterium sp.]
MKHFLCSITILLFSLSAVFAQKDSVYMFSYFVGNGEDGLHLLYSEDGFKWETIERTPSFLTPKLSSDKLMRDPCIIRGKDNKFHMVWTVSWTQKGIGYASSDNLVDWSEQLYIPVMEHQTKARNTWAPEVTYDPANQEYMIYWATTIEGLFPETQVEEDNGYNHRMYYVTTKDFVTFSETKLLYEPGFNSIDATIKHDGSKWVMFIKDETRVPAQKNIKIAYSDKLTGPYSPASKPITGSYWAEGPTTANIDGYWTVYFDRYIDNRFGVIRSKDLKTWEDISGKLVFPKGLRHGTIFRVSRSELDAVLTVAN